MMRNRDIESGRNTPNTTQIILTLVNYFVGFIIFYPLLAHFIVIMMDPQNTMTLLELTSDTLYIIKTTMISSIITLVVQYFISKNILYYSWKFFFKSKETIQYNFKKILQNFAILIGIIVVSSVLSVIFNIQQTSANEESLIQMAKVSKMFIYFSALIFAPLMEEIVFRNSIFAPLRKKSYILAYIVSGFLFGFLHVLGSLLTGFDSIEIFYFFVYSSIGIVFCKVYEDTGSIWGAIILHAMYNLIGVILM